MPKKRAYRKVKRVGGPFACCDRSFIDCVGLKRHLKSTSHLQYRRLKALIESRCVSFKEIGRRVGVSGERVRQIAEKLSVTGFERKRVCTLERNRERVLRGTRLARFTAACNERDLAWELITNNKSRSNYQVARLRVEGMKVSLRVANERGIYLSFHSPEVITDDVLAYELPDGRWMFIRREDRPPRQTMFAEFPDDRGGTFSDALRHDYPKMINAWDVFKKKVA